MKPSNATIALLDRSAARLGLDLAPTGRNGRTFRLSPERDVDYSPGGKGVLRVKVYVSSEGDEVRDQLEAETVCAVERIEQLMIQAKQNAEEAR